MFFPKNSPFRKKLTLQIPCFFQKIPCFTKFPGFQIFKSLKNTRKNHVFLYKNIYLQIKNIYKRQAFILCIIFTVFSSFFSSSKKLYVNICFLRYFNTLLVSYHFHIVSFLSFLIISRHFLLYLLSFYH